MSKDLPGDTHVATLFDVVGPSKELLRCAVFETDLGLELRLSYSDGRVMQREVFRAGENPTERIAAKADGWRRTYIEKGFREVVG